MTTERSVSDEVLAKLKQWEGCKLYAYDDATGKRVTVGGSVRGTLTIGYGHTKSVTPGMSITEARADDLLRQDLRPCELAVNFLFKDVQLTDGQYGALVSFAFNLGHSTAQGSPLWSIAQTLNTRPPDYAGALRRMGLYNKVRRNGQLVVSPGLVNRRAAEAGLWATGQFVSSAVPTQPEVGRQPLSGTQQGLGAVSLAGISGVASAVLPGLSGLPWQAAVALVVCAAAVGVFYIVRSRDHA